MLSKSVILYCYILLFSSNLAKSVTFSRDTYFARPYIDLHEPCIDMDVFIENLVRQGLLQDFEIKIDCELKSDRDFANAYFSKIKNSHLGKKLKSYHETLSFFKLEPLQAASLDSIQEYDILLAKHWKLAVQGLPTRFENWENRCQTLLSLANIAYSGNVIYDGISYPLFVKNKMVAGRIYARFLEEMGVDETWKVIFDELNNQRKLPRILEEDYRFVISKLEELDDGQTYIFESSDPLMYLPFSSEIIPLYSVKRLLQAKSNAAPILAELKSEGGKTQHVLAKDGDDLRNDAVVLSVMGCLNEIWRKSNIRYESVNSVYNRHFQLVQNIRYLVNFPSTRMGYIQLINNATGLDKFRPQGVINGITQSGLVNNFLPVQEADNNWKVHDELFSSAVATFVSGYIIDIGDRHEGNFLRVGEKIASIDFGFICGEKPYPDTADFPIPSGLRNLLVNNGDWDTFKNLSWEALQAAKRNYHIIAACWVSTLQYYGKDSRHLYEYIENMKLRLNIDKKAFFNAIDKGTSKKILKDITHRNAVGESQCTIM